MLGSARRPVPKESMMRFYSQQHRFYCGVDLHTRTLSLCVLDSAGAIARGATAPRFSREAAAVNSQGRVFEPLEQDRTQLIGRPFGSAGAFNTWPIPVARRLTPGY